MDTIEDRPRARIIRENAAQCTLPKRFAVLTHRLIRGKSLRQLCVRTDSFLSSPRPSQAHYKRTQLAVMEGQIATSWKDIDHLV